MAPWTTYQDVPKEHHFAVNHTMDYIHSMHINTMIHIKHAVNSIHKLIPQTSIASLKIRLSSKGFVAFCRKFVQWFVWNGHNE